jgi:hypothetical protein
MCRAETCRHLSIGEARSTPPLLTPERRGSLSIQLPVAKGSLTLSGNFNAFDLIGDERALVFAMLDLMQDFAVKHAPVADPLAVSREYVDDGER